MLLLYNNSTFLKRANFPKPKNSGKTFAGIGQLREEFTFVIRYMYERPG
jgi:hypothetical protein